MPKNSNGDYWRPGMNWFKPTLMGCQSKGCENKFYQKAQTGRKYCDDCQAIRARESWQRRKKQMIERGIIDEG